MASAAARLLDVEEDTDNYNAIMGVKGAPDLSLADSVAAAHTVRSLTGPSVWNLGRRFCRQAHAKSLL
jgi:hypothetical protein